LSAINHETGNPFYKDLAYVGALAIAVAAGTFLLAGVLTIFSVSSDLSGSAAVLADLASANVIIAIVCASAGGAFLLTAAAMFFYGRFRSRV